MLVLSRKKNEALVVNGNIKFTILEIDGDKIKVGIDAPKEIPIYREELYNAIKEQERLANKLKGGLKPDSFEKLREQLIAEVEE